MKEEDIKFREKRWEKLFSRISKLLKLKRNLSASKTHFDFGCGLGIFIKILAEKFPKISFVGIDIEKSRIKTAKQRYAKKNLKFKCSEKIAGKYDSTSTIFVLHEIKA